MTLTIYRSRNLNSTNGFRHLDNPIAIDPFILKSHANQFRISSAGYTPLALFQPGERQRRFRATPLATPASPNRKS